MAELKQPDPITFENADIGFLNFSGKEGKYNREGDRNFALFLDSKTAEMMLEDGWNVKFLKPREEGDEHKPYIQIAVGYKARPPRIVLITNNGKNRNNLDESMVQVLDFARRKKADLIIRPYLWEVNGNVGIKAYVQTLFVTLEEDELELKYADVPDSAQNALPRGAQQAIADGKDDEVFIGELEPPE